MRNYSKLLLICFLPLFYSCSKSTPQPAQTTTTTPGTGTNPGTGTTTGTTPNPNAYVVKTIGISRIVVGADDNNKLTVANLYGGGNKVILKAGTGNSVEFSAPFSNYEPDNVSAYPDGSVPNLNQAIDNGNPPYDTTGVSAAIFKIKGFDKSKTGYNQLNLVMCNYIWAKESGWAGFQGNLTFFKMKKAAGTTNANYGVDFLKKLFGGNMSVTDVEIAVPKSANPYITEDQIASFGQAVYNTATGKISRVDLKSPYYRSFFSAAQEGYTSNQPLTFQWFNATKGTVIKLQDYVYAANLSNIKVGGLDQVVDPVDSVDKVYLRISGFDPSVFGFNQIRLFIANDSFYDGTLELYSASKLSANPTLSFVMDSYKAQGLYCNFLHPQWHHY